MTIGIGGSSAAIELAKLKSVRSKAAPIQMNEYLSRLHKVRSLMLASGIDALYLDATSSLRYFTGMQCYSSERLHGAILMLSGDLIYVCPTFEEQKTKAAMVVEGDFLLWEEHENPMTAVAKAVLIRSKANTAQLAVDPQTPFFIVDGLQKASSKLAVVNADSLIWSCRQIKSQAEILLLTQAKAITLTVQQSVARILELGIDTRDVQSFLDAAHIASGMDGRSTFKIVLFGEPTAYPHGVSYPQTLAENDMVLIDTGATLHGYNSDITRSYVFGEPNARQREIWSLEHAAQQAAFNAAQIGAACSAPDDAARAVIEAAGYGPDYQVT